MDETRVANVHQEAVDLYANTRRLLRECVELRAAQQIEKSVSLCAGEVGRALLGELMTRLGVARPRW